MSAAPRGPLGRLLIANTLILQQGSKSFLASLGLINILKEQEPH